MTNIQKGILLFIIAWTFIPIMDGIAKYLSTTLPVIQIVWARYFFTCILIVPIIINLYGNACLIKYTHNYYTKIKEFKTYLIQNYNIEEDKFMKMFKNQYINNNKYLINLDI